LIPLKFGGTGSNSESQFQPDFMPDRFESGTLNLPGIAGLKAGVEFVQKRGIENIRNQLHDLVKRLVEGLSKNERIMIYGPKDLRLQKGVVSVNLRNRDPSAVADTLSRKYDIAVRVGLHCSPVTHQTIGTFPKGTVRIGIGISNRAEDIEKLCEALWQIAG
jgi:selenocysteine lyase/cysteine desulfurase